MKRRTNIVDKFNIDMLKILITHLDRIDRLAMLGVSKAFAFVPGMTYGAPQQFIQGSDMPLASTAEVAADAYNVYQSMGASNSENIFNDARARRRNRPTVPYLDVDDRRFGENYFPQWGDPDTYRSMYE